MKRINIMLLAIFTAFLFACDGTGDRHEDEENTVETEMDEADHEADEMEMEDETMGEMEKEGIRLTPFENFKQFSGVTLSLNNEKLTQGEQTLQFKTENFTLGELTSDYKETGLANSKDGQHIHVILDKDPYMAKYKPEVTLTINPGNMALLAFPSRSYHLSVKDKKARVLKSLNNKFDVNKPHLFYSRPKGEYAGDDAKKILLDFYLVNAELSGDGYYVEATIDNGPKFKITKWQPYIIEGLKMGEHSIKLELFDKDGNSVQSPLNPVTRTGIILKEKKAAS